MLFFNGVLEKAKTWINKLWETIEHKNVWEPIIHRKRKKSLADFRTLSLVSDRTIQLNFIKLVYCSVPVLIFWEISKCIVTRDDPPDFFFSLFIFFLCRTCFILNSISQRISDSSQSFPYYSGRLRYDIFATWHN